MRHLVKCSFFLFMFIQAFIVHADRALLHQRNTQFFIRDMVNHYNFDKKQLIAILNESVFQPQIIESMDRPYEKKNWDVYKALFLTPARVEAGVEFWRTNQKTLEQVQKQYGVPADMIVAIIGVETLYGKNQGKYRVLDALTTLAFHYPKRSEFFTKELREYLLLCREQRVSATKYLGSYAGAIGKPQFMPSSYRFYAIDFNGKGQADLMSEDQDVISSVANYFAKHGWKNNEVVAEPALIAGDAYKQLTMNSKTPDYSFRHLLEVGVKPEQSKMSHPGQAGVIELLTDNGAEYWLAYPNFYVITHYNTSPQYALVVYLLSQQLREHVTSV
ncbi:MAG: lytic murein transglycosylase B [Legionellaceae bacterium]|nr:lytic murein transglycosylase B [Legionellaceae bacterium]